MSEPLKGLLADRAAQLVHESFTGVEAEWWWERRIGGGIAVCQTLDPEAMSEKISGNSESSVSEIRATIEQELGLEDFEPITLTFEVSGDASIEEAEEMLANRSRTPEGIAAGLYQR
ncbi:MAG: hypothetical protein ACRDSJ_14720, partial [Rubrobacteraceae bacterium]